MRFDAFKKVKGFHSVKQRAYAFFANPTFPIETDVTSSIIIVLVLIVSFETSFFTSQYTFIGERLGILQKVG